MMRHLYFIRSRTGIDDENYYESKTDVWVFGDKNGFDYLSSCVRIAESESKVVFVSDVVRLPHGMQAVVLPAVPTRKKKARLRFVERVIFKRRIPAMELVIRGNCAGYQHLSRLIDSLSAPGRQPLLDHEHFDDTFSNWLIKRSVALNVRAALPDWSRRKLGEYRTSIYNANPHSLPEASDIEYLTPWRYAVPDENSPYLRLE